MRTSALFTIVIVSTSLFLTLSSNAQNSQVKWSSFAVGFGLPSSENSAATSSAGESFAGISTNENSKVISGFLAYKSSGITDVSDDQGIIPTVYKLNQNYPNPFNPSTIINYQIPEEGFVTLKIYDILGDEVKILVNENKSAGSYNIRLDASGLASGMYIYRLTAGNYVSTKKMLMIK
jgi:hypothetical protein